MHGTEHLYENAAQGQGRDATQSGNLTLSTPT